MEQFDGDELITINLAKYHYIPFHWLKYTLEKIMAINHNNLKDLYPQTDPNYRTHRITVIERPADAFP